MVYILDTAVVAAEHYCRTAYLEINSVIIKRTDSSLLVNYLNIDIRNVRAVRKEALRTCYRSKYYRRRSADRVNSMARKLLALSVMGNSLDISVLCNVNAIERIYKSVLRLLTDSL